MNYVSFDSPKICPNCGSKNWKINGTIYNEEFSRTQITLQCVRCRTTVHATHAHTYNDHMVTISTIKS